MATVLLIATAAAAIAGPVKVVTTIPDLADWVSVVGGERVEVRSILSGIQSPHTYEPKPGDAKMIAEADLLVEVGLGLEEWLSGLLEGAAGPGLTRVQASEWARDLIAEPAAATHESHGPENPHIWLDPATARRSILGLSRLLAGLDTAGAETYRGNARRYVARLDSTTALLQSLLQSVPNRKIVTFHPAWPYFGRFFGLEIRASIEPIPGQEPSARYAAGLIKLIRSEAIRAICSEPQLPSDVPDALARETGARVITLSPMVGALEETPDYVSLLDYNVRVLVRALSD